MATIALIWELGSDLGHIGRFLPIAQRLKAAGHRPVMILRDISRAHSILASEGLEYCQAPLWLPAVNGLPPPLNFTETLFRFGFLDANGLSSIISAWRTLFGILKPDLLVFDHAPSALLAARGLEIPRLVTGNSFAVPPQTCPLPAYKWWESTPPLARVRETEERVLRNCNAALALCGGPPLLHVADLYDCESTLITGAPELDVYGPRADNKYCGPINSLDKGVVAQWPSIGVKKIFAYLKPQYKHFEAAVGALKSSKASCVVFAPGLAPEVQKRLQSANLAFSMTPLLMRDIQQCCDVAVCHAGGIVDVMLEAGKPLVLLPMQTEQTMTSRRVEQLGGGLTFEADRNVAVLPKLVSRVLNEPEFTRNAADYAARNARWSQAFSVDRLIAECERLLAPTKV